MPNSKVQTLTDLVRYGYTSSYSIQKLSLYQKENNVIFMDKLVYQKYDKLLMEMSQNVEFSDEELSKFQFNPERLSAELYGTPNLSHLILYINRCAPYEFKRKNVKLIPPNYLERVFQKIIEREQKRLTKNHNSVL